MNHNSLGVFYFVFESQILSHVNNHHFCSYLRKYYNDGYGYIDIYTLNTASFIILASILHVRTKMVAETPTRNSCTISLRFHLLFREGVAGKRRVVVDGLSAA
jgi:hypothetical protein